MRLAPGRGSAVDGPPPRSSLRGIVWPALASRDGAAALAHQWQLERSQWWSADRIVEHQFRQLRVLAQHASESCPYYARHLDRAGLRDVSELEPDSFLRWPVLRKSEVRHEFLRLRASRFPPEHGAAFETYTTGSTGEPTCVQHSERFRWLTYQLVLRDHLWHRRDLAGKFAAIRINVQRAEARGWGPATDEVFETGVLATLASNVGVDEQLAWLAEQRPAYLLTYPSNLQALLLLSRRTGRVPSGLREVLCFGEAGAMELAALAREAWGARLVDVYSCNEAGTLALQCPEHGQYHVQSESVYLEVLREDGSPCRPGETGRVVVSSLHNFPLPLIRYELGDYAEVGEPCACGRGLPVLARIAGRARNMAVDPTGRRFWPRLLTKSWWDVAALRQLQLVQRTERSIEVRYVMDRDLASEEALRLAAALNESLGYPYEIAWRRTAEIQRAPGTKFEEFVSQLSVD